MALLPDRLEAGAIELRRADPAFAMELVEAVRTSFAELHRWMPWAATPPTIEGIGGFLEEADRSFALDEEWLFVLWELGEEERVVGSSGLHRKDRSDTLEIGYWVRSDRAGRGFATAAARSLTEAAFAFVPGVERVEIQMDKANEASAAIPAKLGYRLIGEIEREIVTPGHTGHGLVWAVERADRRTFVWRDHSS